LLTDDLPIEFYEKQIFNYITSNSIVHANSKKKKRLPQIEYILYKETLVDFKENFWVLVFGELLLTCNPKRFLILM
jgi:hypothetical protein